MLILFKFNKDKIFNASTGGDDCAKWLLKIAESEDRTVNLRHLMDFVNGFMSGKISRSVFWEYAKFRYPTHQISFHTVNALRCLTFERSESIHDRETER